MENLAGFKGKVKGYSVPQVQARLDALMMVMKSCKGDQCRLPWSTLHPGGKVSNLGDAMNSKEFTPHRTSSEPGNNLSLLRR